MGIVEPYMVKTVEGNTQFTLAAESGESLLITGIKVLDPNTDYASLYTERTLVGYFRVGGTLGNHLFFAQDGEYVGNLLDKLIMAGWLAGYPVGEGETFAIDGVHKSTSKVSVEYVKGDAGEFTRDMANGSASREYLYLSYGRYSTTLADGDNVLATVQTPVEFPGFPFGDVVPAGNRISLLGIAASDYGLTDTSQANQQRTRFLKLIRDRMTLMDQDRNGLPIMGYASTSADEENIGEGYGVLGNNDDADLRPIFSLPEPIVFEPGSELIVNLNTEVAAGSANITAAGAEVAMIQRVERG